MANFSDRVKQLRQERNMKTAALAAELDKTESAIRMWESGKSKPDVDTLITLSGFFGCSVGYLLGLENYRNIQEVENNYSIHHNLSALVENLSVLNQQKLLQIYEYLAKSSIRLEHSNVKIGNENIKVSNVFFDTLFTIAMDIHKMLEQNFYIPEDETLKKWYLLDIQNFNNICRSQLDYFFMLIKTQVENIKVSDKTDEKEIAISSVLNDITTEDLESLTKWLKQKKDGEKNG